MLRGKKKRGIVKSPKLEKKRGKNKRLEASMEQRHCEGTPKSAGCITAYFSPPNNVNNVIKTELEDSCPMKELFKTDETPVAVPCQTPPTPHRINMPNIECPNGGKKVGGRNIKKLNFTCKNLQPTENHKVTEYFPIRRSVRKCKKTVLEEKQRDMENKVLCEVEDGLEIKHFVGKGRGVVTTRPFIKGEFVVEYAGELIDQVAAKKREAEYAKDHNTGCYMYYFQHRNHQYCVDATAETNKLGRLVNHCRNGNLIARVVEVGNIPHLVLTAKEDIPTGVELSYDYGDRSREAIRNHPWLVL